MNYSQLQSEQSGNVVKVIGTTTIKRGVNQLMLFITQTCREVNKITRFWHTSAACKWNKLQQRRWHFFNGILGIALSDAEDVV